MWYVASLGGGLALGIGFLIWALKERSKRHAAETNLTKSRVVVAGLRDDLEKATVGINKLTDEGHARENQLKVLRETVDELRGRLRSCQDPEAIRSWLDTALGSGLGDGT
jgi:hypothetical protein